VARSFNSAGSPHERSDMGSRRLKGSDVVASLIPATQAEDFTVN